MDHAQPVVHGYYRWTDIFYQWPQVFAEEPHIRSGLKGFLSPAALTHPDHPLRSPCGDGVELWIGTLQNGKLRLMFSSAQVEYMRYWVKAIGFTQEKDIPIPDSTYLLTLDRELRAVSPVVYNSAKAIKEANKNIEKSNKRLMGPSDQLVLLRSDFERARNCWHTRTGIWCAMDFESWERDHTLVTEVGLSRIWWVDGSVKREDRHIIVAENKSFTNSVFIQGNRDHFLFGKSEEMSLKAVKHEISNLFEEFQSSGPLFLVFHSRNEDVKILKEWSAPMNAFTDTLPDSIPDQGVFALDTADLFAALSGAIHEKRSLKRACQLLQLENLDRFHNAGNDAHFTLRCLEEMAGGLPLDMQRESRWPNQTTSDVKVEWKPWQEDDDFSDMEGMLDGDQPELMEEATLPR